MLFLFIFYVYLHLSMLFILLLLFFIHFLATLSCHRHSILASQAREGLHQFWALPWVLLIAFSFSSTASAMVLSGHFLPVGVFYFTLLLDIFGTTCFYQGLPGSPQFFLEVCRASYWSSKHRPGPSVCLWIKQTDGPGLCFEDPQSLYILNLYSYMSIFQKFLLAVKTLIKNKDQQPHYSATKLISQTNQQPQILNKLFPKKMHFRT